MYNIALKKSAVKDLEDINEPFYSVILKNIETLKENPRNQNVKKLVDRDNEYRLRSGNYRILFYIEEKEKKVVVSRVVFRKDAYK
ncbi:MAG: Plasmid stabilization system protein [Spirochaetes bacterium ADurb.Bin133]|nr:MAG: Plasmid stabilization system protein [Spirochaetes bacterium ADurb.Bin133]